jgi:hypothetical protein
VSHFHAFEFIMFSERFAGRMSETGKTCTPTMRGNTFHTTFGELGNHAGL